ncbi:MAG: nickel-dependent hydrogenase large subunit [Nanoarchaeota archaeon]|nr:nickel-dependent hydrogenase large subunit [Nanoarchaeota archaeon]
MHKDFDLKIENMSKIEGHASLEIKVRNGAVESAKLIVGENKRFYEEAMRGKPFSTIPQMVSRICGTCSIAHLTCATEAIEKALDIKPSKQTLVLRKLATLGTILRDHAMHLYFFVLPDIFRKPSVFEFDKAQHKFLHDGFSLKAAGNKITKLVAGRAIHAIYSQIGYFSKVPDKSKVKETIAYLKNVREKVFDLIDVIWNCDFSFKRKTNYVALADPSFAFLEGDLIDSYGDIIKEKDFSNHLNEIVIPYSQGEGYTFKGEEYFVGALARLNVNKKSLHENTKKDLKKYLNVFPSSDIYHNNLAQAIEMLHCIDASLDYLEFEFKKEKKPEIKIKKSNGVGVVEAPRGVLYYKLSITKEGKIDFGTLVTPTAQNQIRMENDIKLLVTKLLDKPEKEIQHEVEKLIRAYDPCMTCASNFLKIKWI